MQNSSGCIALWGLGTDNSGFGQSQAVWTDYADFPVVVQLLRSAGFSPADVGKLAGGNYVRVFNQSVHAVERS